MILSDQMILKAIGDGDIKITPFDDSALGSNSYDVHLSDTLLIYTSEILDCKKNNPTKEYKIGSSGIVLMPGTLYLGATREHTETKRYVPFLDGRSSIGRLGIFIHCTAGVGDINFCGFWTLEITVAQPIKVYADMRIGQLIYFEAGTCGIPYNKKTSSKYNDQSSKPMPSKLYKDFK